MSVQQSVTTGLIGLVIAGAGAVGIYNFSTSGCFLGSCSSGASASTGENAAVGLIVSGSETEAGVDSCCAVTDADKAEMVAVSGSEAVEAPACEGACEHASGEMVLAAGETLPECCAAAMAASAETEVQTEAPASDG